MKILTSQILRVSTKLFCESTMSKESVTKDLQPWNLKDVRAHSYCASLQRTQIHMPRHASSARAKY